MKLSLLYLFAIANSKLIRRETEGDDAQVVNTAVEGEGEQTDPAAPETDSTEDTESTEIDNVENKNVTGQTGGDEDLQPANLEGGDQPATDDSATGEQTDEGTATDDATGGEATDGTSDDTATGDETAQEGDTAAATGGNATDTSDGTGNAMTMMLSSIFVVLFMIIH